MIVLGIVLILIAAAVLLAGIFGASNEPASIDLGPLDMGTTVLGIFLLGAATLLVFVAGLELIRSGVRRGYHRRRELKEAREVMAKEEHRDEHRRHGHPPPQEAPERGGASPDRTPRGDEHAT